MKGTRLMWKAFMHMDDYLGGGELKVCCCQKRVCAAEALCFISVKRVARDIGFLYSRGTCRREFLPRVHWTRDILIESIILFIRIIRPINMSGDQCTRGKVGTVSFCWNRVSMLAAASVDATMCSMSGLRR